MMAFDYSSLDDERLCELMFTMEDRLPKDAALELASRATAISFMTQLVMDKQNWLVELPEWWAVVHSTYVLGHRGGEGVVLPLVSALRWSDAFDCDWVTEVLPSILGKVGPAVLPMLTAVTRDLSAGWSARDLAMKGLAALTLHNPESCNHVFRIIGERLMDEGENMVVRQLAGQILLDFRRSEFRLPLLKFSRQAWSDSEWEAVWNPGFGPEEVEWAFHNDQPEVWHYNEDWMRFYDPAEIQRRQKRWCRERISSSGEPKKGPGEPGGSGGQLVSLLKNQKNPPEGKSGKDPDKGPE